MSLRPAPATLVAGAPAQARYCRRMARREIPERPELTVDVRPGEAGGRTVVAAAGEVDLTSADRLAAAVREALGQGPVLLDLEGVTFMDSSGIRVLDALLRDCAREDWDLRIGTALTPAVTQIFDLTGMSATLPFDR